MLSSLELFFPDCVLGAHSYIGSIDKQEELNNRIEEIFIVKQNISDFFIIDDHVRRFEEDALFSVCVRALAYIEGKLWFCTLEIFYSEFDSEAKEDPYKILFIPCESEFFSRIEVCWSLLTTSFYENKEEKEKAYEKLKSCLEQKNKPITLSQ